MREKKNFDTQGGNALFLILIAVILFAALAYAITKSEGGSANNATEDRLSIEAAKYGEILNQGMAEFSRLRLKGCRLEDIESYQVVTPKPGCAFFAKNGGNFPFETIGSASIWLYPLYLPQIGSNAMDVAILILNTATPEADRALCNYFNKRQNISVVYADNYDISMDQPFESSSGNMVESQIATAVASQMPVAYNGKAQGCAADGALLGYAFYQVVEAN